MAQAHFPSKEEVEAILVASGSQDGAIVLVTNPTFISIKRELFIYGLNQSSRIFLDIIRSLDFKNDTFPVQVIPFIITGGSAVAFLTGTQLETPDLDIELCPFDLRAARRNNEKRLVCQIDKGAIAIDPMFQEYVSHLFEQMCASLSEGLPVYEQITLEDTRKDTEIRQGLATGRIVGNVYVALIFNPTYYSKLVVVAKLGAFVERIFELKFPKTVFGPSDQDFVISATVPCQAPEKMIKLNIVSMNDKLRKMRNAMRDYNEYFKQEEGEEGKENGYWLNQESQKRDAIITYKVRIVSHFKRINLLNNGFSLEMINPENRDLFKIIPLELTPYITQMERNAVLRAVEAQEIEARAAAAAAEESQWERPKKAVKGRSSPSEVPVTKPSGFEVLRFDDDEPLLLPDLPESALVKVVPVVAASAAAAAVEEPTKLLVPSHMVVFVEKPSIDYKDAFNHLHKSLIASYSPEGKEHQSLIIEINTKERRRANERNPLLPGIRLVMDSEELNGAEEICFHIIPKLSDTYSKVQIAKPIFFSEIIGKLHRISWFIKDKTIRDAHQKNFDDWLVSAKAEGKIMSRRFEKITFKSIYQWMQYILNALYTQENGRETLGYLLPPPYQVEEIAGSFEAILSFIDSTPICPCIIPPDMYKNLVTAVQASYSKMKSRNLIALFESEFTSFYKVTVPMGTKKSKFPPILFLSFPTPYAGPIVTAMLAYIHKNGTTMVKNVYKETREFFSDPHGEEVLRVLKLDNNIDDAIHLEGLIPLFKQVVKNEKDKIHLCKYMIFSFQRTIVNFNTVNYWKKVLATKEENFSDLYLPSLNDIIRKEMQRKEVVEALLMKEAAVAEAAEAEKELLAEEAAEKTKKKGKKKGGYRKTRKIRR
jgi:hypothetical protein